MSRSLPLHQHGSVSRPRLRLPDVLPSARHCWASPPLPRARARTACIASPDGTSKARGASLAAAPIWWPSTPVDKAARTGRHRTCVREHARSRLAPAAYASGVCQWRVPMARRAALLMRAGTGGARGSGAHAGGGGLRWRLWRLAASRTSAVRIPSSRAVVASWKPSSPRPIIAQPTRMKVAQYTTPATLPPWKGLAAHAPESHLPSMAARVST